MKISTALPDKLKHNQADGAVDGTRKLDFRDYELEHRDLRYNSLIHGNMPKMKGGRTTGKSWIRDWAQPSCVPIVIIFTLAMFIVSMAFWNNTRIKQETPPCHGCRFQLVESMPENLTYVPGSVKYPSIYSAWVDLIESAETSIDIAALYWSLLNDDITPKPISSSGPGEDIFYRLNSTGVNNKVKIRIAQNSPSHLSPQKDSALLAASGAAQVRSLHFGHLVGGGVLHTKLWVVDGKHLYVGSANMDWRSLTQVKEVGMLITNCSCMAQDMSKIFEIYWQLGKEGAEVPKTWPHSLDTIFNIDNQMPVVWKDSLINTYLSSSPPPFCPDGRSNDIDAITDVIKKAEHFVYIAVMDYFPRTLYSKHKKFWPVIDDSLKAVAMEKKVNVHILASHWNHTRPDMKYYLKSLQDLTSIHTGMKIETKLFVVPAYTEEQREIPFARVNHNKYMVTDNTAYIGTSNWSADYFINTGGVGLIVNETIQASEKQDNETQNTVETSLRQQLQDLFERDWNSEHAKPIEEFFEL